MSYNKIQHKWDTYYSTIGLREEFLSVYSEYYGRLLERKLPPIFGFKHLSMLVGIEEVHLAKMINASNNFYRTFSIKKNQVVKEKYRRHILHYYMSRNGYWIIFLMSYTFTKQQRALSLRNLL